MVEKDCGLHAPFNSSEAQGVSLGAPYLPLLYEPNLTMFYQHGDCRGGQNITQLSAWTWGEPASVHRAESGLKRVQAGDGAAPRPKLQPYLHCNPAGVDGVLSKGSKP